MNDVEPRDRAAQWFRNRRKLLLNAAVLILFAAVVAVAVIGQKGDGTDSSGRLPTVEASALSPARKATQIFDRGGPNGGIALGTLQFSG
ncbi:MAG: hypothetical protein ABI782_11580, partial [Anaerolineaceae bacterium]